jgi:hypothetical protein
MFKKGDLVEVSFWDYKTNETQFKNGVVTGHFLSADFTLEPGVEVLIEEEKVTIRAGRCRCVNLK